MRNNRLNSSPRGLHYTILKQGLIKRSSQQGVFWRWVSNSDRKMNTSLKHQVRKSKTYKIDSGGGWGGGTGGREPGSIGGGRGTGGGREKGGKQEF